MTRSNPIAQLTQRLEPNQTTIEALTKVCTIFKNSEAAIRPHFILTGPSGSGKSHLISHLAESLDLGLLEINAAQLTKEGTAGNSLSKALTPAMELGGRLTICFVDEFDKLFISGNSNSSLAHEVTHGVQNEFLKVLESETTQVFGDYGKYKEASTANLLFVFAGAFNGEELITLDRLREFGIKTEFLGRVGLNFYLNKLTINELRGILESHQLLRHYLALFPFVSKAEVMDIIMQRVVDNYEKNTLGARMLTTLLHQYFINGGNLDKNASKKITFQKTMTL